jgi:hypothetical protein
MTVRRLRGISATHQSDILAPDERLGTAESSQRSVSTTYGETQAHAGHRTRLRLLWRREIRVAIYIDKAYRPSGRHRRAQQAPEDDAAIAAEEHDEPSLSGGSCDAVAKRFTIGCNFALVPGATGRTNVVSIRRRYDVAYIDGAQSFDNVESSKCAGRAVKMPGFTRVIGPDADAGRSSDDGNRTVHGVPRTAMEVQPCL